MEGSKVLRVERGERIVLSPDSPRFRENYQQLQPRTAMQAREILGMSPEVAKSLYERGVRPERSALSSAPVAAEDLDSRDEAVRARARTNIGNALLDYVYAPDTKFLTEMEPAFVKHLEYLRPVIMIAVLPDIEVAAGATMVVSVDTHVLKANNIVISGTGRIVCLGPTKFEANSIVGN